jgi:hypothetical protein
MRRARGRDRPSSFQFDPLRARVAEAADADTGKDGDQMDLPVVSADLP